jgi:hypothetical protein
VSPNSHLGEVSTSYFTHSTPLGSTIPQRKMIGSNLLMIMKHCTKFQVSTISHTRGEVSISSTSNLTPFTPLGSTINNSKKNYWILLSWQYAHILMIYEALYKVSSLCNQPSQRRRDHKLFHTLHPLGSTITQRTRGPWATSLTWVALANIEMFFFQY